MGATPPTNYKMSDVVNKLLRPSLTSYYQVDIKLPPNVEKFLNFRIPVDPTLLELITLSCSEASLPGSSIATHEVNNDYPGVSEKMAYRRLYDDRIDFTFYVDHDYSLIQFFEGWMNYVVGEGSTFANSDYQNRNTFYRMNYPEDYKTDELYITKFEKDYTSKITYQFINAFPISITSIPVSYDSSQLMKCTVSFSYSRFVRDLSTTVTPTSATSTIISGLPGLGPTPPGTPLPGTPTGGGTVAGGGVIV